MRGAGRTVSVIRSFMIPRCATAVVVGLLILLAAERTEPAYAATFTVTKTADTNDGTCDADCSLREAIGAANALPGLDTIDVPLGTYSLSLAGAGEDANLSGDLDITDDLRISGTGPASTIVDGGALDRVFHIVSGAADISDLTIRNGDFFQGGGVYIWHSGNLALNGVTVSNSAATAGGGLYNDGGSLTLTTISGHSAVEGGGIYNDGELALTNSTVSENEAALSGGGILNQSNAPAVLTNAVISDNIAAEGGGIAHREGDLTLTSSAVRENSAGYGGGIWTGVGGAIFGSLNIVDSTITENAAQFWGGGIFFEEGVATIEESTISNNTATTGGGLGAFSAEIILKNSTVSGNEAIDYGGGIAYCLCRFDNVTITNNFAGFGGGLLLGNPVVVNNCCADTKNTIIAANADLSGEAADIGCLGEGTVFSRGYNIIQNMYAPPPEVVPCLLVGDMTGNILGQDPVLGPLANNGGPTFTHALLQGSPAIDAGSFDCPPPATDQRGVARPVSWACDIGAFESAFAAPTPVPGPPAVGGVAGLLDVDNQAAALDGRRDNSSHIAALAAAVVLVGFGGWFASRRWLR